MSAKALSARGLPDLTGVAEAGDANAPEMKVWATLLLPSLQVDLNPGDSCQ